ncbi:tape measure protein [Mycobacterium phage Lemuria]|uniref:Tape measure protein n=1 Tax=Mycobacterium phage Lemuria TaxID=2599868 RepID=A0A5J6THG3_9CAUD|nr:endolysin [Mycobacterium phage Lemuria]QFG10096.1 tape measure protein [Mycobacterium phage Lemuria]
MQGTYWLTVLPETSQLRPRIKRALRGLDDDVRVTPTVDDRQAEPQGRAFGDKFAKGFGRSGASKLGAVASMLGVGIGRASDATRGLVRNVGLAATGIGLAARITKGFALSLMAASTGLRVVAGVSLAKLAGMLGFTARQASKLASAVTRVTSAILLLTVIGKTIGFLNRFAKMAAIATVGTAALIGVVTALASVFGQALVSAVMVAGAAIGTFAGAAVGLLGPALGVLKLGLSGLKDGADAFADSMKDAWGPADEAFNKMIGERLGPLLTKFRELKMAVVDTFTAALGPALNSATGLLGKMQPAMVAMAGTLGKLGSQIAETIAGPENVAALDKMFAASNQFVGSLGPGLSKLVSGLVQFASTAADTFKGAGVGISDMLGRFGDWLKGISPAQMIASFAALRTMVTNVWNVLKPILEGIRQIGAVSAPALAPGIKAIGDAIAQAVPGLVRMSEILMPALSAVMERLAPIIPALVTAFTPWAGVLAQVAPPLATIVAHMAPLAPLIMVAVGAVKAIGAAMIVWNTVAAAASIAQGIFAAATGASTASLGGNVIALAAHRTATIASTIASRALGVAMTFALGPIGLIIAAVVAVGAAIWAFFTKTETGKRLWEKIWPAIVNAAKVAWQWIKDTLGKAWETIGPGLAKIGTVAKEAFAALIGAVKTVWTAIQPAVQWAGRLYLAFAKWQFGNVVTALKALGAVIGWLWQNVVVPAFNGIASAVQLWWAGAQAVFGVAKTAVQGVGDVIMWLWNNVATPAFSAIGAVISTWWAGVEKVWGLFQAGVEKVGSAITTMKDAFTTGFNAIKGVVESVWNFIGGILDKIGNAVGTVADKLRSIPGIGALIPGNADGKPAGFAGGRPATLSRSGQLSGPGTGTSDSILAMLSDREGIVKASAMAGGGGVLVAALNSGWTPTADQLHALLPGFAEGLNPGADWLRKQIMDTYPQIKTIGGKRSEDGYGEHSSGNAIDVMIPGYNTDSGKATGDQIASWIKTNRDELGVDGMIWRQTSFGYGGDWTTGKTMSDRGSDTQNHMDHLHVILGKGRGAGAPSVDAPASSLSMSTGASSSSSSSLGGSTSLGSGSYRAATDKELASGQGKVDTAKRAVEQANQGVDDATYRRDKAARRLEELRAAGKDTADAQHSLDVANRELTDAKDKQKRATEKSTKAEQDFATLQSQGVEDASAAKDSAGGSEGGVSELGKSIWSGLLETIGLDGSLFSNPFEWPTVKSIMAGVNVLGGTLSGQGAGAGSGGDPSGVLGGLAEATGLGDMLTNLNPGAVDVAAAPAQNVAPDTTEHGTGGGQAPGPGVYIENAGMAPVDVANKLDQTWNARTRTTKAH